MQLQDDRSGYQAEADQEEDFKRADRVHGHRQGVDDRPDLRTEHSDVRGEHLRRHAVQDPVLRLRRRGQGHEGVGPQEPGLHLLSEVPRKQRVHAHQGQELLQALFPAENGRHVQREQRQRAGVPQDLPPQGLREIFGHARSVQEADHQQAVGSHFRERQGPGAGGDLGSDGEHNKRVHPALQGGAHSLPATRSGSPPHVLDPEHVPRSAGLLRGAVCGERRGTDGNFRQGLHETVAQGMNFLETFVGEFKHKLKNDKNNFFR